MSLKLFVARLLLSSHSGVMRHMFSMPSYLKRGSRRPLISRSAAPTSDSVLEKVQALPEISAEFLEEVQRDADAKLEQGLEFRTVRKGW